MLAVVQIGSRERRSPCITARIVLAREGCALSILGIPESAVVASVPCTKRRRVGRMKDPPSFCCADLLSERMRGTRGALHHHSSLGQFSMRPDGAARFREGILARVER